MTVTEKLDTLEELLDIEKGTLSEETELDQLSEWDSLAVITLIAMLDEKYGKSVTPKRIKEFKTVKDIIDEME